MNFKRINPVNAGLDSLSIAGFGVYIGLLAFVLSTAVSGCKKPEESERCEEFDRVAYLTHLADHFIVPGYTDYAQKCVELNERIATFTSTPSASNLSDCREAYQAALSSWQKVAMFEFGPAEDVLMQATTNVFPADTELIEENISEEDFDLSTIDNFSAKGFPAIDYLLFFAEFSTAEVVEQFSTGDDAAKRQQYLSVLSDDLAEQASEVSYAWVADENSVKSDFISDAGTAVGSSMGLYLNAFNKSYETYTRTAKVGIPLGALTFSQTPIPTSVEAFFQNDQSIHYLRSSVEAFAQIYRGEGYDMVDGPGLDDYLIAVEATYNGAQLHQVIDDQIEIALDKIDLVDEPLSDYVVNQQDVAFELYAELQALTVLWKVDMMSAFGILITYQDNDGD